MSEYLLPLLITAVICFLLLWILKKLSLPCDGGTIEIVIDGNESKDDLEKLIMSSIYVSENHLIGAKIYLCGGDPSVTEALCKNYNILQK